MATSGSIKTSKYNGRYYKLAWERTSYSVANNTSTIKWTLSCHGGSSNWYAERTLKAVINGKTVFSKTSRKERYTGTIDTGTMTIKHNSDGTKSFSLSLKAAVYVSSVNCTGSGTHTLTAIPRQANLTAAPNFNDEQNPTITYSNPAGSVVESLDACIANSTGGTVYVPYRAVSKTGTSYTFSLTDAERTTLRNACTTAKSMTVKFYLRTVIGGNTYYSTLSKTLTIVNANPVITATAVDGKVQSLNLTGNSAKMIKGFNGIDVAMTSKGVKGATIVNEYITNNGKTHDITSGTISNAVNASFNFYAKDSRGYETTKTITLGLINYIVPTCNLTATMTADGILTFNVKGNYFNASFGAVANTLTLQYRYKTDEDESYSAWTDVSATLSGNTYSYTGTITGLDYQKTYLIQARAVDKIKTVNSIQKKVNAYPIFDWGENDFNFNVPVSLANAKQLMGTKTDGEKIIMASLNTNNQMFFGYGGYDAEVGTTYFDGNAVSIRSKGNISSTAAGTIGGNKAWTNSSDARLKANISEIPQVYADIWLELTPRIFEWNELNYGDGKKQFGLIAQEAIEVFNKYGVNYEDLDFISTVSIDGVDYFAITYEHYHILTAHVLRNTINELVLLKQKVQELTS